MAFTKRILSVLMVAVMLFTAAPFCGFADMNYLSFEASAVETEGDYEYYFESDRVIISGYSGDGGDIVLPSSLGGKEVYAIGGHALCDNNNITGVTIPESIVVIRDGAFKNCTNLSEITVHDGVYEIGWDAFLNTAYYNNEANWTDGGLYVGKYLVNVKKDVQRITIKEDTLVLANYAFYECSNIESVTLPDNIKVGVYAFISCDSLKEINAGENNEKYSSVDGVLFDKYKLTLVNYPVGNERKFYKMPDSVNIIAPGAFASCKTIEEIVLSGKTDIINGSAFDGCTSLKSITMPDTVSIISGSFNECSSLKDVYYAGSPEKWANIYIEEADNESLIDAEIHYNYDFPYDEVTEPTTNPVETQPTTEEKPAETTTKPAATTKPEVTTKPAATTKPEVTTKPGTSEKEETETVKVKKPGKVKIKSAKSTGKKKAIVTWAAVKNINGYEVQYSTNKKFTKKATKKVIIKKAKTKKTTLKKLKSGKKYFIRVRAYKTVNGKKLLGAWSKVKTVKVK